MHHWEIPFFNSSLNLDTLITMWTCMAFVIAASWLMTRKLSIVPGKMQLAGEGIMHFFWGLTGSMIGKSAKKHVPLLASLFLFILTANLCGQIPWRVYHLKHGELASPTNDINLTAAMAVLVLIYYVFQGVKAKGPKYFLHSLKPIDIVVALIELFEMFIRPFTLALRLFANILAGELLVIAFIGIFAYLLPLPIMLFEVFVAVIQTLVFTMLSTAYIALAVAEDH